MSETNEPRLILTNLSLQELDSIVRKAVESVLEVKEKQTTKIDADEIGGIDLAIELTGLAKPTIYSLCSERKIPHSKKSKFLYFSRKELTEWLKQGKRKTQAEIAIEAANFGQQTTKKEAIQTTKPRNRFRKG